MAPKSVVLGVMHSFLFLSRNTLTSSLYYRIPFHDPRMMIPCDGIPVAFGISKTWFSVFIDGKARTFCRARHFLFFFLFVFTYFLCSNICRSGVVWSFRLKAGQLAALCGRIDLALRKDLLTPCENEIFSAHIILFPCMRINSVI